MNFMSPLDDIMAAEERVEQLRELLKDAQARIERLEAVKDAAEEVLTEGGNLVLLIHLRSALFDLEHE